MLIRIERIWLIIIGIAVGLQAADQSSSTWQKFKGTVQKGWEGVKDRAKQASSKMGFRSSSTTTGGATQPTFWERTKSRVKSPFQKSKSSKTAAQQPVVAMEMKSSFVPTTPQKEQSGYETHISITPEKDSSKQKPTDIPRNRNVYRRFTESEMYVPIVPETTNPVQKKNK